MGENKKIKGAKSHIYNGVKFRSALEVGCYKLLEQSGLDFTYESERVVLFEGLHLEKTKLYAPKKDYKKKGKFGMYMEDITKKVLNMTYTPDFIIIKGEYKIYFDAKGFGNDTYPIKKKIFLKELEMREDGYKYIFMEPHNQRQMKQGIEIINEL